MTREQVIMSLGYPPTHRTASLASPSWTYWNTLVHVPVLFGEDERVNEVVGLGPGVRDILVEEEGD